MQQQLEFSLRESRQHVLWHHFVKPCAQRFQLWHGYVSSTFIFSTSASLRKTPRAALPAVSQVKIFKKHGARLRQQYIHILNFCYQNRVDASDTKIKIDR
jgi:hypothetical protein